MKLAVVGGGSTYTPELVDGLVRMQDLLSVEELTLMDPDRDRLDVVGGRAVRLVLHGADKREATARLLALDRFDPKWPASIVHEHADAQILVDRAALS